MCDSAFENCSSLNNVTVPGSVHAIGDYAFATCRSLNTITIPTATARIGVCVWLCVSVW